MTHLPESTLHKTLGNNKTWYLMWVMFEHASNHISVLCIFRHGDDLIVTPFAQVDISHTQNV